jgi:hypothetical protein
MKIVSTILAACVGLIGFAAEAQATSYKITIDCHGTNGAPNWSYTADKIAVGILYHYGQADFPNLDGSAFVQNVYPTAAKCDGEDEITVTTFDVENLPEFEEVTGVYLSTGGSDAFFVDQVKLKTSAGTTVATWGADDNTGFCLSNQVSDASAYCQGAVVYGRWNFPYR